MESICPQQKSEYFSKQLYVDLFIHIATTALPFFFCAAGNTLFFWPLDLRGNNIGYTLCCCVPMCGVNLVLKLDWFLQLTHNLPINIYMYSFIR